MKKITKIFRRVGIIFSCIASLLYQGSLLTPVQAEDLDIRKAVEEIISPVGNNSYHYSFEGGNNFDSILTGNDAADFYDIGLDCTAGTLAIVSKALRNAGMDPYKYFEGCREYLNKEYPWDLSMHFTNMLLVTNETVNDISILAPGDILIYGKSGERGHMSVYAGEGQTFDFGEGNYANFTTYQSFAISDDRSYSLSAVYRISTEDSDTSDLSNVLAVARTNLLSAAQVTDDTQSSGIHIYKTDRDTGKNVTLTSSAFKIKMLKDAAGNDVSSQTDTSAHNGIRLSDGFLTQTITESSGEKEYNVFMTASLQQSGSLDQLEKGVFYGVEQNKDDTYSFCCAPVILPAGEYELWEVITSEGFVTNRFMSFSVNEEGNLMKDGQVVDALRYENSQLFGSLYFKKEILDWEDADISLLDHDMKDFGFTLFAMEDILSADDGSVLVKKGDKAVFLTHDASEPYKVIEEVHPEDDGNFSFTNVPLGKYVLKETTSPKGYVVNNEGWQITITQSKFDKKVEEVMYDPDQEAPKVLPGYNSFYDRSVKDSDVRITIEGEKTDTYTIRNEVTKTSITKKSLTSDEELEGAYMCIKDEEGNIVTEWISTNSPYKIAGLAQGDYRLVEQSAPDGYYFQSDIAFSVNDTSEIKSVEMKDRPIVYQIRKIDENGERVEGVTLKLFDVTDQMEEIELPNKGVTTKNPFTLIQVLKAEHVYELREVEVVQGYFQANSIQFTVPKYCDRQYMEVVMEDLHTNVSVHKVDQYGLPVSGARLSVFRAVKNDDGTFSEMRDASGKADAVYEFVTSEEAEDISKYVMGSNEVSGDVYYLLKETETPYGYETSPDIVFKVTGNPSSHQRIQMVDCRKKYSISVVKTDAADKTKKLEGARFRLLTQEGEVALDANGDPCEGITNKDGSITWYMEYRLDANTYDLKEVEAPQGYLLSEKEYSVSLSKGHDFSRNEPVRIVVENQKKTTVNTGEMPKYIWPFAFFTGSLTCLYFMIKCRFFRH